MVALDVCFTKNKKYPTQLFLATVHDGTARLFHWRMDLLPQKGLEKAVSEMLPENPHMHCGHHLKMNVQKHFGKVAVQVLQSLFHAPSEERFNSILEEVGNRLDCGREFVQYIRRIDPERFVCYALPLPRYGRTTSNSVEVMNGALKPIRDFAPCRIAGQMWMYMLHLFCERRETANRSTERFTAFAKE
ncbi:hypothetical protein R1sor_018279 [Riccia sorocarpa]|uniref:Transposase n=1 Tax=Riccia sorocarpa TaxID=122646 RepID=A0ABD3IDB7_9MARC